MASPINNIPESIIEETLIQLEGDTDTVTNLNSGSSRLIESNPVNYLESVKLHILTYILSV